MAKLLIVEDDEVVRKGLEGLLSTVAGHEVQATASGEAALDALRTSAGGDQLPDLIITDVVMPGMSGLKLLEIVRAQPEWEGIPFLFITAQRTRKIEEQIGALDNAALLYKPFDPEGLQGAVGETLGKGRGPATPRP